MKSETTAKRNYNFPYNIMRAIDLEDRVDENTETLIYTALDQITMQDEEQKNIVLLKYRFYRPVKAIADLKGKTRTEIKKIIVSTLSKLETWLLNYWDKAQESGSSEDLLHNNATSDVPVVTDDDIHEEENNLAYIISEIVELKKRTANLEKLVNGLIYEKTMKQKVSLTPVQMLDMDDPAAIKIVKSILNGSCGTLSDNTLKSVSIDTLYSVAQSQQDRNLVTRSRNILKTNGVNDLYALSIQTYQTMKGMRNAGNKVIAELKDIITALGREMKLRNENPIDDPMNTPFYCKERADFMRKHGLYTYRDFINAVGTGKVSLDNQHESVISFKNACFERFSSIIGKKGD